MHENREISCTSWLTDQDRSAKAINRTADVHVQEKSDCAVVPVNQPNKEGQPSAEAGEVAGPNNSERQDSPEIDRGGSSRPYPVTGKAEILDAVWQVSRDASGVRTASMQPKDFMGTRESRQVQA